MPTPGVDTYIVDESNVGSASDATDTLFLLSPDGPETPTATTRADTGDASLDAQLRAYFEEGGKSCVLQGYDDGYPLPALEDALGLLPAGPGQVVVPEAVEVGDLIDIANISWSKNKVALLQGPPDATDQELEDLAAAVIAGTDARGAALFADYSQHTPASGSTIDVIPWTVVVAGLIARNDRLERSTGHAAAGKKGIARFALGLEDERGTAAITDLSAAQVNCAKTVNGTLRNYGFRTLADLDTYEHWWDLTGSRTVMWFRARAAGVNEDFAFETVDGKRRVLNRFEAALRAELKDMYDKNALFGETPDEAYSVDTSEAINPIASLAQGEITAQVRMRTSPFAEHVVTNITRRAITAPVA